MEKRISKVAVIGLGKIGLPLAAQILSKGLEVVGCDANPKVLEEITRGTELYDFEPGLFSRIHKNVSRLTLTTSAREAAEAADIVIVVVPLIVDEDKKPDFKNLKNASIEIGKGLRSGSLVIYETTLPIGGTKTILTPLLEKFSGLTEGKDFFTAYAPERVSSGTVFADLRKYPKIVGACSPEGSSRVVDFYSSILEFDDRQDLLRKNGVWLMEDSNSAEFVKLAETTFRDVNIALANTFAINAAKFGLDFEKIREASNSQPFSMLHEPGISVGGHCIPVYPHLYLESDPDSKMVSDARELNSGMPLFAVRRLESLLGELKNRRITILGLAYRAGVKEHAFSGTLELKRILKNKGARVCVRDPLYTDDELLALGLAPEFTAIETDALLVHTNHKEFGLIEWNEFPDCKLALEGRGPILNQEFRNMVTTKGIFS